MARNKFKYVDKNNIAWDRPIDAETGKPLVSSVAKKIGIVPKKSTKN